MSEDLFISFKLSDLLHFEASGLRPRGYVADVLKSARKRGSDVVMSMDAYKAFCAKYDPRKVSTKATRHDRSKILMPNVEPKPILGPTGLPLQKACCGSG